MRNIASGFPACMFIPIIASRRVTLRRLSSESCRNLDQSRCRNVQARSRSNPSCRTDGRTYEISSPGCSLYPDRVQHPSLFSSGAEERECGPVRKPGKNQVHCDRWLVPTIYSVADCLRGNRGRSNFARARARPRRGTSIPS